MSYHCERVNTGLKMQFGGQKNEFLPLLMCVACHFCQKYGQKYEFWAIFGVLNSMLNHSQINFWKFSKKNSQHFQNFDELYLGQFLSYGLLHRLVGSAIFNRTFYSGHLFSYLLRFKSYSRPSETREISENPVTICPIIVKGLTQA